MKVLEMYGKYENNSWNKLSLKYPFYKTFFFVFPKFSCLSISYCEIIPRNLIDSSSSAACGCDIYLNLFSFLTLCYVDRVKISIFGVCKLELGKLFWVLK